MIAKVSGQGRGLRFHDVIVRFSLTDKRFEEIDVFQKASERLVGLAPVPGQPGRIWVYLGEEFHLLNTDTRGIEGSFRIPHDFRPVAEMVAFDNEGRRIDFPRRSFAQREIFDGDFTVDAEGYIYASEYNAGVLGSKSTYTVFVIDPKKGQIKEFRKFRSHPQWVP